MILIAGLGNKDKKYRNTPHNIGFETIDFIQEKYNFPEFSFFKNNLLSKKGNIVLIKPQTYMNNSGIAIKEAVSYFKIKEDHTYIIQDENKLELGTFEISKNIPAFGHKGIQSIIENLKTQDFTRVRIGIKNKEVGDLTEYVLKKFKKQEQEIIRSVIQEAIEALDKTIQNNIED